MEHLFDNNVSGKKFTAFVTPSVIMFIVIALYSVIDIILVSHYVGEDALAAMSIVYPIQGLIWGVSIMLASGASAIVAMKMGEGKHHEANEKFTLICLVSAVIGVVMIILGIIFLDEVVGILGSTEMLWQYCMDYAFILLLSAPAAFLGVLFEYFIRVDGRPGITLFLYCSGGVVHVILALILMGPMNLGIKGSAWATVAGMVTVMVLGLGYFLTMDTKLKFVKPKLDGRFVGHCIVNGSSEMVSESSVGITTFLFNMIVIRLVGESGVAALAVVLNVHYLLISTHLGFITGVSPLISYYYGAKNYDRVNIFLRYSKRFILWSSIGLAVVCFFGAPYIAGIFTEPSGDVYDMAMRGIRFLSGAFLFTGINIFASGFFTAYGNGQISAIISLSRALIMVIVGAVVLSMLFGLDGVWMTLLFADLSTMGLSLFMFRKYKNTYHYKF